MNNLNITGDGKILHAIKVTADELQNNMLEPLKMRNTFKLADMNLLSKYLKADLRETAVFVAIYVSCYNEGNIGLKEIAEFFNCTPFDFLSYHKPLQSLIDKGLVIEKRDSSDDITSGIAFCNSSFGIAGTVSYNILNDKPITDANNQDSHDVYDFIEEMADLNTKNLSKAELVSTIERIEDKYNLESVSHLKEMVPEAIDRGLYYRIVDCFVSDILLDDDATAFRPILSCYYTTNRDRFHTFLSIKEKMHPLIERGLIRINGGNYTTARVRLTMQGKTLMLQEYANAFFKSKEDDEPDVRMIEPEKIRQKELFFEENTDAAYKSLIKGLSEENFNKMQKKLYQNNMPTGVTAIFYGHPGTGKTEMAYQIAKATGRKVIPVDVTQTKDMWFGESEKKMKEVFESYKRACMKNQMTPILLFNEADAVFSKRKDIEKGNCAHTENAMQNIILEEMEKFKGIMIATTNLEDNFDKAFERRFLYKVKFERPSEATKMKIWRSKMPKLTDDDALTLARNYDFSGGEIDNIVRKAITREITECLDETSFDDIVELCESERFGSRVTKNRIGFRA